MICYCLSSSELPEYVLLKPANGLICSQGSAYNDTNFCLSGAVIAEEMHLEAED